MKPVFEILADVFCNEETELCFALLGDANMSWAAALADRGCRFIYVRDEHCAVAAAMAWSRTTGKVGVATVTCGPGVTQITTALPAAVRAGLPLVIFAGEAPVTKAWYNQKIEQEAIVKACGADYVALHQTDEMPTQIRDAFLHASRKRLPVVLGVPFDLQESEWTGAASLPAPSETLLPAMAPESPHPDELSRACELIRAARRVVIMAGLGAVQAKALAECRSLAKKTDALLATTLPARGAFHNDQFCIGIAGGFSTDLARQCLQRADLIIAVGCSLAQHNSDAGKLFSAENVLHIDLQPLSLSQGRKAAVHHMQSDARLGVSALLQKLDDNKKSDPAWRTGQLADEIKNTPADTAVFDIEPDLLDPRAVVLSLNKAIPVDWHLVNSSGHCSYFFAQMPGRPVERFLTIREFGSIGNGIAFAIGVASACPERTIVLFDGDGSLLMHIQELETIRRHKLKILICVMNDGAYGSEIHKLRSEGLSTEGAVFGRPDFAEIARGFGIQGKRIEDLKTLESAVREFDSESNAAIWDFHVSDKVISPVIRRSHH